MSIPILLSMFITEEFIPMSLLMPMNIIISHRKKNMDIHMQITKIVRNIDWHIYQINREKEQR